MPAKNKVEVEALYASCDLIASWAFVLLLIEECLVDDSDD